MKFGTVKDLDDEKFRRLTGVKRPTFNEPIPIKFVPRCKLSLVLQSLSKSARSAPSEVEVGDTFFLSRQ
jgi:hypothetical protein